jgi:hypothetical protein
MTALICKPLKHPRTRPTSCTHPATKAACTLYSMSSAQSCSQATRAPNRCRTTARPSHHVHKQARQQRQPSAPTASCGCCSRHNAEGVYETQRLPQAEYLAFSAPTGQAAIHSCVVLAALHGMLGRKDRLGTVSQSAVHLHNCCCPPKWHLSATSIKKSS